MIWTKTCTKNNTILNIINCNGPGNNCNFTSISTNEETLSIALALSIVQSLVIEPSLSIAIALAKALPLVLAIALIPLAIEEAHVLQLH